MTQAIAFSILALTVGLSLSRPRIGWLQIRHAAAAVIGALLTFALGLVSLEAGWDAMRLLFRPIVTIASLMVVTLVAEEAGLFELLANRLATDAKGSGRRLLAYLFLGGTALGMVFTNDAAVLIFTPLVFHLTTRIADESWTVRQQLPYFFAVLFVGNLVGALVISNPINIIVSSLFGIAFLEYARWMVVPALVSILASFYGLLYFFRGSIPLSYRIPLPVRLDPRRLRFARVCVLVLAASLVGFFTEAATGIPPWVVAVSGAMALLLVHSLATAKGPGPILRGVGWDVLIFVVGIFIVALGLRTAGLTDAIGRLLTSWGSGSLSRLTFVTGLVAATCSAVINNHPTAGMMALVIQGLHLPPLETKMVVFSALVGGDLGPKMLPIGSLAALMWFRLLRDRGVQISYRTYIAIGVPVSLAAVLLSIAVLNLEYWVVRVLGK